MFDKIMKSTNHFFINDYPAVAQEVKALQASIAGVDNESASAIIISFLKDHCISAQAVREMNPIASLIRSRAVNTNHIQDLFATAKDNREFVAELEQYLRESFGKP